MSFGGLVDEMPPTLPFLCLHLERFVVVQVDGRGIRDGIGSGSYRDHCVGDGSCHCLGHGCDEAPRKSEAMIIAIAYSSPSFLCFCALVTIVCLQKLVILLDGSDRLKLTTSLNRNLIQT